MGTIAQKALALVLPRFALSPTSRIHGAPHWATVAGYGRPLAESVGANPDIAEWFGFLHDAARVNDDRDPCHGPRASILAHEIREAGHMGELTSGEFDQLATAIEYHSCGFTEGFDAAVMACWDADRLDLLRVGIIPDPQRMCTPMGKHWAASLGFGASTDPEDPGLPFNIERVRPRGKSVYNFFTGALPQPGKPRR